MFLVLFDIDHIVSVTWNRWGSYPLHSLPRQRIVGRSAATHWSARSATRTFAGPGDWAWDKWHLCGTRCVNGVFSLWFWWNLPCLHDFAQAHGVDWIEVVYRWLRCFSFVEQILKVFWPIPKNTEKTSASSLCMKSGCLAVPITL